MAGWGAPATGRTSLELAGVGVAFDDEHRWVVTLDLAAE